ncbi:conserved protein of unknown function (plasmid) [Azospirillum lipoferum 4B]|uniref:Uncharacterized protein n=1 Tax=Azospirillum lipoferum (strain 4B) TaxID=862719 RepID=G7ZJ19_AZOL4|nr:conserved protein of unknown function [Azospirillum lipoferum 4B]
MRCPSRLDRWAICSRASTGATRRRPGAPRPRGDCDTVNRRTGSGAIAAAQRRVSR